jgi:abhydrolase domain-containing protein 6
LKRFFVPATLRLALAGILLFIATRSFADAAVDPLSRWIVVNGLRIHYLEAGREKAGDPVILMVHGYLATSDDFRSLMLSLPTQYCSIAVDLPGFGLSAKPDAAYDTPYFVAFLRSFAIARKLSRFVLVGHSLGGKISTQFTFRWASFVTRLILIDSFGLAEEERPWAGLAQLGVNVDRGFRPSRPGSAADLDPEQLKSRATARITKNMIGHDPIDGILPRIRQKALPLWGDADPVLPSHWSETFRSLLPNVRFYMISDAGHVPMVDKPEVAGQLIVSFLTP